MDREANEYNILEQMLIDADKEPSDLPLSLLKDITNNFSEDLKIGNGGFAVVYKGLLQNGSVAVKRLLKAIDMDEKNFNQEVSSMIRVKHKNIVRFLGYCADTQGKVEKYDGKMVIADVRQRLLCFEFMKNGGLDKHINDSSQGLEWKTRYQIIKGICEGLHYLHQMKIVHRDLKPANILLDYNMVPKIADFGLSKCFDEKQTRVITLNVAGSPGYMAPESFHGEITFKSDIYSLGILISEILTGKKGHFEIENVLESWSARLQTLQGGTWLEHVRVCAEIALKCMDSNPSKRPLAEDILKMLVELECTYGVTEIDHCAVVHAHPLQVHPMCPVTLTNMSNHLVAVWIAPTTRPDKRSSPDGFPYLWEDASGIINNSSSSTICRKLKPHSSVVIFLTITPSWQLRQKYTAVFDIVMFTARTWTDDLSHLEVYLTKTRKSSEYLLNRIKELGTVVYRETLSALDIDPTRCIRCVEPVNAFPKFIRPASLESGEIIGEIMSIDVHSTETWVLVAHARACFSIWNYDTQERIQVIPFGNRYFGLWPFSSCFIICSTKFIAGEEQWFAAGDSNGYIHVYAYTTTQHKAIKKFEAYRCTIVDSLAVHPTDTLLLTASTHSGESIKLWDWVQDWACVRVFKGHKLPAGHLSVGPRGTNTFACSFIDHVKVWEFHSSDPIDTFSDSSHPIFHCVNNRYFITALFQPTSYGANIKHVRRESCLNLYN